MAGNIDEWVFDRWSAYSAQPCNNCATIMGGDERVRRGGFFDQNEDSLRSARRNKWGPASHNYFMGFRCTRSP